MSKKWYPVINFEICIECGRCVEKCKNGVYEKNTKKPNVINPQGCIDGCRGCQNLCPAHAIEYVGDNGEQKTVNCGCSCN